PYTHSLLGAIAWAAIFTVILLMLKRDLITALIGGAVVLSHWFMDLLVHRPDLTLAGGDVRFGFGIWNYPVAAIALELSVVLLAFFWYTKRTKGPVMPPLILLGVLLLMQAINWFGPEPAEAGLGLYLTALVSYGVAAAIAKWVGETRRHIHDRGLAASGARR
ncbi:MAG: hypothetical protein WAT93_11320, partial [Pontixanthobacter sp.]